jgi:phosphoribosylaminoimidazolecarboxamide formyltransferase/IMP cyclohydrolase
LSFNNLVDADAALNAVLAFDGPACVIVKHANPCGVAIAANQVGAYMSAFTCDPISAFGGVIAFNGGVAPATAEQILAKQFAEVIIAPSIDPDALGLLATKPNIRVLECGTTNLAQGGFEYKSLAGGLLLQDRDVATVPAAEFKVVTERRPSSEELADLNFAWTVVRFVKSNAIVFAAGGRTLGIGAGQPSRIMSTRIAGLNASAQKLALDQAVMASDAFFPFRDGIDAAAELGIRAVIQPGGSMRDDEVITAANELGMSMVFTGRRHFRH